MNFFSYILNTMVAALVMLIAVNSVQAHPGHGESDGHSLLHYITEPVHAIPLLGSLAFLVVAAFWIYRKWFRADKNQDAGKLVN
ncbi:hypothetical protein [Natronogracilivirga saccharolytica]|uniref:Uncharacterized protein n=1 Tax=Natronogracilivirga saccharolytica TaxID=2812953 RepID=A0A8J7UVR9_9BACT|nr:hypothetical protein [Natronogracilivirga saccharolytica]MBP3193745.1 hypothetical protein [Natronogracilivirga saccharolytica]